MTNPKLIDVTQHAEYWNGRTWVPEAWVASVLVPSAPGQDAAVVSVRTHDGPSALDAARTEYPNLIE